MKKLFRKTVAVLNIAIKDDGQKVVVYLKVRLDYLWNKKFWLALLSVLIVVTSFSEGTYQNKNKFLDMPQIASTLRRK